MQDFVHSNTLLLRELFDISFTILKVWKGWGAAENRCRISSINSMYYTVYSLLNMPLNPILVIKAAVRIELAIFEPNAEFLPELKHYFMKG